MRNAQRSFISKFSLLVTVLAITLSTASAQSSRVDSVLLMIGQIRIENGIDTSKFWQSLGLIQALELSDRDITRIEDAAILLNEGESKFMSYCFHGAILQSLIKDEADRAIFYGRGKVESLQNERWPYADWMESFFLKSLRIPYRNSDRVKDGIDYFSRRIVKAKAENDSITLASCHYVLGGFYSGIALLDQAIYNMQKSISCMDTTLTDRYFFVGDNPRGKTFYLNNNHVLGLMYKKAGKYEKALDQFSYVISMSDSTFRFEPVASKGAAETYLEMDSLQSIPDLLSVARSGARRDETDPTSVVLNQIESLYCIKTGNFQKAQILLDEAWKVVRRENIPPEPYAGTVNPDYYLALLRRAQGNYNEAINYLLSDIERVKNFRATVLDDYKLLAELYEEVGDGKMAAETYRNYIEMQEEILAEQAEYRASSFELEQEMNERALSIANLENENKLSSLVRNFTIGLAFVLLILALAVYNRYRTKQRDNKVLSETLSSLKSAQAQLIQSEKMASLGELTAGIAHEIQNPLNFVNNFSEVSQELIDEMAEEIAKGDLKEVKELSADIKGNLEKITHHGKRADAIVKGMLAHSRSGKGEKAPTDINALAEEYLKLSYHGLRAKDKSFNADFKTDFDPNLPKISVVPQDIGRVLLNLINNAFQAVSAQALAKADRAYKPTVTVKTQLSTSDQILVTIEDNGPGIPSDIKDKIFQPFFTTKPTGQGTGLGLSLSYDIIKAHGGEITCKSEEGKGLPADQAGTEFIIKLPQN